MPFPYPELNQFDHRSFPPPASPWSARQLWDNLLFLNYPIRPEDLAPLLPEGLEVDTYNGEGWVSIVPFQLKLALRGTPRALWPIQFDELNVRTYVSLNGVPGVYFFSLDANDPLSVWSARWLYQLPYFEATCTINEAPEGSYVISSKRTHPSMFTSERAPGSVFAASYKPIAGPFTPERDSLENWLTARWCFYTPSGKSGQQTPKFIRGNVHHEPWPLQAAEVSVDVNTLLTGWQLPVLEREPTAYFSKRVHVVNWLPENVTTRL